MSQNITLEQKKHELAQMLEYNHRLLYPNTDSFKYINFYILVEDLVDDP